VLLELLDGCFTYGGTSVSKLPILGNTDCIFEYFHVALTNLYFGPAGMRSSEVLKILSLSIKVCRVFTTLRVHKTLVAGSPWRVNCIYFFFTLASNICGLSVTELALHHPYRAWRFEVAPRFL
jgi:hypothetical protein